MKGVQRVFRSQSLLRSVGRDEEKVATIRFSECTDPPRYNTYGIQMIPESLRRKLFTKETESPDRKTSEWCSAELGKFGLNKEPVSPGRMVDVDLPEQMRDLPRFFQDIATEQLSPYSDYVEQLVRPDVSMPEFPAEWSKEPGWTQYTSDGPRSVPFPSCSALVFDVEVCIQNDNHLPAMAIATSPHFLYSWVSPALHSPWLYNRASKRDLLIPLGDQPKIVVGHHVSYDRARVREEYGKEQSALRFLDTQSLHVCVSGLENHQKGKWLAAEKSGVFDMPWMSVGATNSLAATHKFYCGETLDKSERDLFVTGSHADVQENFQGLMSYCAGDVRATLNVLKAVWRLYKERFPSPVTLSGMLQMASCFIPANRNWHRYLSEADEAFHTAQGDIQKVLANLAEEELLRHHLQKGEEKDWWSKQLDWSTKKIQGVKNKKLSKKAQEKEDKAREEEKNEPASLAKAINSVCHSPEKPKHYLGAPEWYRGLCPKAATYSDINWSRGPTDISLSSTLAPLLLRISCHGFTVWRTPHHGFGFLRPKTTEEVKTDRRLLEDHYPDVRILDEGVRIEQGKEGEGVRIEQGEEGMDGEGQGREERMEHIRKQIDLLSKQDEPPVIFLHYNFERISVNSLQTGNVGSPLGKAFAESIDSGVIVSASDEEGKHVLTLGTGLTSWRNTRSRIFSQFTVDCDQDGEGAILPQVTPAGTITRRATENLWMTASNVKANRVGSEFKGAITPPPGYSFVGADVDSQELWIASLLGDSTLGSHGATPLGWMSLQGKKSAGTDMHSMTAAELSAGRPGMVSRDMAKAFNYARIYGSGKGLARNMLRECCKELSEEEIETTIDKMFARTKGEMVFPLTNVGLKYAISHGLPGASAGTITAAELTQLTTLTGLSRFHLAKVRSSKYAGGSESAMFNRLEEIARSPAPATPFLGCRITRTLEPAVIPNSYQLNSRVNWVVQSSAVDFLHLLLVAMKWFMKEYAIPGRFSISIHDEVRFMVPDSHRYEAALALQLSNLLTRAFFATQLGIHDLPNSVAFFSGVDVDRSLRKSVSDECLTPSNPLGLSVSYGIAPGRELDVFELMTEQSVLKRR